MSKRDKVAVLGQGSLPVLEVKQEEMMVGWSFPIHKATWAMTHKREKRWLALASQDRDITSITDVSLGSGGKQLVRKVYLRP